MGNSQTKCVKPTGPTTGFVTNRKQVWETLGAIRTDYSFSRMSLIPIWIISTDMRVIEGWHTKIESILTGNGIPALGVMSKLYTMVVSRTSDWLI